MKRMNMKQLHFGGFMVAALLSLTSCADYFQGVIPMDTVTQEGSLAELLTPDTGVEKLGVSEQLFASQGEYPGRIKLQWLAVDYAKSYCIERALVSRSAYEAGLLPDETEFVQIVQHNYSTQYTDTILPDPQSTDAEYGNVYFYRVQAENIGKKYTEGDFTDYTKAETQGAGWLFAPPTDVDATKGKSQTEIKVTWKAASGAGSYRVYRGLDTSSLERVGTINGNKTEYIDSITAANQGVEYYYKVTAVNSLYIESERSTEALGYALKAGAPVPPETVTITNGLAESRTSLNITWPEVSAAEGTVSYSLYRTSSIDPVYTLIKSGLSGTTYNDETVKTGIIYYYYVQTVVTKDSGEILKSSFSDTGLDSDSPAAGFLLSPPSSLEAVDGVHHDICLRWLPAAGSDYMDAAGKPYKYFICTSDDINGEFTRVTSALSVADGNLEKDSDGYLFYELGKAPYYKVITYNASASGSENESVLSSAAAPLPSAPLNVTASKSAYVGENWTPNDNEVYPVKITWNPPSADLPAGYYIYRSTKPDSAFKKLTESPVVPVNGTKDELLSYVDSNDSAKAGVVYYYKVVSLNSLNQGKKSNDPVLDSDHNCFGWGALTRDQWFREYNKTVKKSQSKLTLMHKSSDTDKLGSETIHGDISGTLGYNAKIDGLGARILMPYKDYADFYINNDPSLGVYFNLTGDTNTSSNMSANGTMDGTVVCKGMYPGSAVYDNLQIRGGAAGGGYYSVETRDLNGNVVLSKGQVDWLVGES